MRSVLRFRLASLLLLGVLMLSACGGSGVDAEDTAESEEAAGVEEAAEEAEPVSEADPAVVDSPVEVAALPEELRGVLASTSGEQIDLVTLRGQDVVLWFWAPW